MEEVICVSPTSRNCQQSQTALNFSHLTLKVKRVKSKTEEAILDGVSGTFRAGQLTAIMGPSGAGKSTLLNILAGFKATNVEGSISLNERPRDPKSFRVLSSYITQDECLLPQLTVNEYLKVAANLKLSSKVSNAEKSILINDVMKELGLSHRSNTRISNLSGGERKRVSIALELVDNPQILFLDEPTSGLDSASSLQCVHLLKEISRRGRIVVASIHQPSSRLLQLFDQLYVVAQGKCIYQGPVQDLVPYLGLLNLHCPSYHNPGDFIIDIASSESQSTIQKLVQAVNNGRLEYRASPSETFPGLQSKEAISENAEHKEADHLTNFLKQNPEASEIESYPVPFLTQFVVLFQRAFISIWREKLLTLVRLVAHVVVGILIGILYWRVGNDASKVVSNAGLIFFNQLFLIFTAMMPTLLTFPLERDVLKREHLNHWYSLKAYFLAKTTADIPFQIIFPIIYMAIVHFMTDQPCEVHRFFMIACISILVSLVAQGFGLLVGAATSIQVACFLSPVLNIPLLLFSGFLITLNTIPSYLHWLTYLSYIRYCFEGLIVATYGYDRQPLDCREPYCHFKLPEKFLVHLEMENGDFLLDCLGLVALFVIIRVASYFLLKFRISRDR